MELIGVVMLISVIFGAGIIGISNSIRLFNSEVLKNTLSDDLEVVFEWIRKDAACSNDADVSVANEVTLNFEDFGVNPSVTSQIRYYVKSGTTEFYRQQVGSGVDGKLITDMIDSANPPLFSKPAGGNYLFSELQLKDTATGNSSHREMGVRLRCCAN